MISGNLETWLGLPVELFDPEKGVEDYETTIYRLALEYDDEKSSVDLLASFLENPASIETKALILGLWGDFESTPTAFVEALVAARARLPNLRGIFIGDIISEENEISWINQTDLSPLFQAFPALEHFRVRGNQGLVLGRIDHANLQSLTIETGGLSVSVVHDVLRSNLPALQHLEVWLGTDSYGWDGTLADLEPLFSGDLFPKLQYLGLKNSVIQDEIAIALARAPVVQRLKTLDLSMGVLSDEGAVALLTSPAIKKLEKLDLHHHYLSEGMIARFSQSGLPVDLSEVQQAHEHRGEEHRYVSVSE